jgi:hypothetical protein
VYALGWRIEKLAGAPVIRHGGEVSNFLAEMVLLPEQRAGVVVLMNASNGLATLATHEASRLASDVARRFLLGVSVPRRLSLRGFYALLNTGLAVLSVYQVWSLARLLHPTAQWGRSALGLAALGELGLAAMAVRGIPRLADSPWRLLRLYVPDITSWLAAFCGASALKCLILLARLLRSRS